MTGIQNANIGLDMDPEVATYVGMLEGTVAALSVQACQNRALLELLTGDGWQAGLVSMDENALQQFAIEALVRQTGMPVDKAKLIVAKRWKERVLETESLVPRAIPTAEFADIKTVIIPNDVVHLAADANPDKNPPASPSAMSSRLADWQARQLAEAESISRD